MLSYNYNDIAKIKEVIMKLSIEVGNKLRNNKMYADTVGIWFKYNYFDKVSKQEKVDFSISTDEEIYNNSVNIFNSLWNFEDGIRSICVFVSGLSTSRKKQLSLFDMNEHDNDEINEKLQNIIDDMRSKYGNDIIKYGNMNSK